MRFFDEVAFSWLDNYEALLMQALIVCFFYNVGRHGPFDFWNKVSSWFFGMMAVVVLDDLCFRHVVYGTRPIEWAIGRATVSPIIGVSLELLAGGLLTFWSRQYGLIFTFRWLYRTALCGLGYTSGNAAQVPTVAPTTSMDPQGPASTSELSPLPTVKLPGRLSPFPPPTAPRSPVYAFGYPEMSSSLIS